MTATVVTSCVITATPLSFGNYDGVVKDATATLEASCTNLHPYTIGLNKGNGTGATITTRKMAGPAPAELLNYTLSQDAGHSINWGDTTDTVAGVGNGAAQPHTVFGEIPAGQFVQAGPYSDLITVTLTF